MFHLTARTLHRLVYHFVLLHLKSRGGKKETNGLFNAEKLLVTATLIKLGLIQIIIKAKQKQMKAPALWKWLLELISLKARVPQYSFKQLHQGSTNPVAGLVGCMATLFFHPSHQLL